MNTTTHLFRLWQWFQGDDVAVKVDPSEADEQDDPEEVADVVEEVPDARDGPG